MQLATLPESASNIDAAASTRPRDGEAILNSRILIVDDEMLNTCVVQSYLELDGFSKIASTEDPTQALGLVNQFRPDLVLLDINMPVLSGLEILKAIRSDNATAHIPVVILTASSTSDTKLEALENGATDLLSKPVHRGELLARIRNVLSVKAYQDRLCRYSEELEIAVRERTADLEASRLEVIHCLGRAAEFRDDDTGKHIIRVGRYARIIGEQLGFSSAELDVLEPAAQLHDVGKIGIPDAILLKPGRLNPQEFESMQKHCDYGRQIVDGPPSNDGEIVRRHTELGAKILDSGRSPILSMAKSIAMSHHERWDGSGYPSGLSGTDIPLEGRITAVADVFDALSSKRSYKAALPIARCFQILEEGRGTHFDPDILDAFFARRNDIILVQLDLSDPN